MAAARAVAEMAVHVAVGATAMAAAAMGVRAVAETEGGRDMGGTSEWIGGVEPPTTQPPVRLATGLDTGPIHTI